MEFFFPFEFVGVLDRYAPMGYTVVFLPPDVISALPVAPSKRPRVIGELCGRPFKGGLHPTSDGRAYFIVNKTRQKTADISLGDPVTVAFRLDDPDSVDVPPALQNALMDDENAREVWEGLTPGTRRGFAHRVASAKTAPTIKKRVTEVLTALEDPKPSPYPKRGSR
ncbi:YdeI/OmpD-associated family protein [Shimia ponticola]|uniref:YdeI/OmpD-associated family protein n=1 Tax=Shimia ponticola TaxID=2582893 RepID=UPI0011BD8E8D|nr:YdeI/OmpD-associated family protein [Shimia ponticola]